MRYGALFWLGLSNLWRMILPVRPSPSVPFLCFRFRPIRALKLSGSDLTFLYNWAVHSSQIPLFWSYYWQIYRYKLCVGEYQLLTKVYRESTICSFFKLCFFISGGVNALYTRMRTSLLYLLLKVDFARQRVRSFNASLTFRLSSIDMVRADW